MGRNFSKKQKTKTISNVGMACFTCGLVIIRKSRRPKYYWHINPYQVVKKKPFCSIECLNSFRYL